MVNSWRLALVHKRHSRQSPRRRACGFLASGALLALVLWLALAAPVTCQRGPMSLLNPSVHEDALTPLAGMAHASATSAMPVSADATPPHDVQHGRAIEPVTATMLALALGLATGLLPGATALPPLVAALSCVVGTAVRRRWPAIPPLDPPPRPSLAVPQA